MKSRTARALAYALVVSARGRELGMVVRANRALADAQDLRAAQRLVDLLDVHLARLRHRADLAHAAVVGRDEGEDLRLLALEVVE